MPRLPTVMFFTVCGILGALAILVVPVTSHKTADDLWAEALWTSLPPNGGSSTQMSRLFVAALQKADRKAPIFVSLGDNSSGVLHFKETFDAFTRSVEASVPDIIASEVERRSDE